MNGEVRLTFAPWLPAALAMMSDLSAIGYRITDSMIDDLIESAIVLTCE